MAKRADKNRNPFAGEIKLHHSAWPFSTSSPHTYEIHPVYTHIADGWLHHAALLNIGEDSLQARLHLIRAARRSIEFQNFLFRRDQTGGLLMFSTNSLAATDSFSAYSFTHKHKKHYIKTLGFDVYEFRPNALDAADFFPRMPLLIVEKKNGVNSGLIPAVGVNPALEMPQPRTGLHAKSFVIDGLVSMVGSHNLDPRGEGFNTENGVIIYDRAFAVELESCIRKRRWQVIMISSFMGFITPVL